MSSKQLDSLDLLTYFSFLIGLANYNETVNQSDVQDIVKEAVSDIHEHLYNQDKKINFIIEAIGGVNNER